MARVRDAPVFVRLAHTPSCTPHHMRGVRWMWTPHHKNTTRHDTMWCGFPLCGRFPCPSPPPRRMRGCVRAHWSRTAGLGKTVSGPTNQPHKRTNHHRSTKFCRRFFVFLPFLRAPPPCTWPVGAGLVTGRRSHFPAAVAVAAAHLSKSPLLLPIRTAPTLPSLPPPSSSTHLKQASDRER